MIPVPGVSPATFQVTDKSEALGYIIAIQATYSSALNTVITQLVITIPTGGAVRSINLTYNPTGPTVTGIATTPPIKHTYKPADGAIPTSVTARIKVVNPDTQIESTLEVTQDIRQSISGGGEFIPVNPFTSTN